MTDVRLLTALLATYLLLPAGDEGAGMGVCLVEAASKCKFNGVKYKSDEVVLDVEEVCTIIQCQRKVKPNGKPSKKVELVLLPKSLTSCTCFITSRASTDLRNLYFFKAFLGASDKISINPQRKHLNSVYSKWKKRKTSLSRQKMRRTSRKLRKKCVYNKGKYMPGETVVKLPERCLDLICRKATKKKSELAVQFRSNCTCSDSSDSGEDGECKYADITPNHSMCQPKNTDCGISIKGVTNKEKVKILQVHNEYRAKVARGEELRGNPGPQPSAADMKELIWNDELAQVAQAWSNTCPSGHDCQECRYLLSRDYFVGQNLYWSWGFNDSEEWNFAITSFYDEVTDVPNTLVNKYESLNTSKPIGHYTQLVWAETQEVGCGAVYHGPCSYGFLNYNFCKTYVCNYGPSGNFLGRPIYKVGSPASQCPGKESLTYNGLCK